MAQAGEKQLYIRVRYEDLVQSPRSTLDRVYDLLGKAVPEAVADFFANVVPALRRRLANIGRLTKNKSLTQLVSGWNSTISLADIDTSEGNPRCRSLMARQNYSLTRP